MSAQNGADILVPELEDDEDLQGQTAVDTETVEDQLLNKLMDRLGQMGVTPSATPAPKE